MTARSILEAMHKDSSTVKKGNFIVFEGIDGSGKTTQINLLAQKLKSLNIPCHVTREPTGGPVGSLLRQFLTGEQHADERVIAALFAADRLDHLLNESDGILKKAESGITVISDRYYLSSYAYHGTSLPMDWVIGTNSMSADIMRPSCHIFIDIPAELAVERIRRRNLQAELYENYEKLRAVRDKYFEAIELVKNMENIKVINGEKTEQELFGDIWEAMSSLFGERV